MGSSSGKGAGGGSGVTSHDYYGTVAAVLRCGPIDTIYDLLIDGAILWSGPINRTDPGVGNPYYLTLTDPAYLLDGGYVALYWGDDTQLTPDPALPGHPPYRGMAYIVFNKFLFGRERTTAPNVEVIAQANARPPASVISATASDADGQANTWAILAELLTSIHGFALDPARLDAASWQAAHDYFAGATDRQQLTYASPLLSDQVKGDQFISQLLALCDGWLRMKTDGTIEAGYYTVDPGDLSQYTTLDANDLAEQPQIKIDSWDAVPTGVVVTFADFVEYFFNSCVKVNDLRALQQAVEPSQQTIQLENYIVRDWQARRIGAEWVKRNCQPNGSGTIKVRAERAVNPDGSPLRVGNRFFLDIDPEPGGAGLEQLCRVMERRRSPTGPVTIMFNIEVLQPAVPYAPAWTPPGNETQTVAAIPSATIVPMPLSITANAPAIAVLAQRGDDTTIGAHVLFDVDGGSGTFTTLGTQAGFSVPCQLNADYSDTATGTIQVTFLDTRDQHLALQQPGDSGAQNDELLLFVFKTDVGGNIDENADGTPKLEWFSIQSSAASGGGAPANTYDFTVLRARQGSDPQAWNADDKAWIIPKTSLIAFTHGNFGQYVSAHSDLVFRLSPFSRLTEYSGIPANLPFHFPTSWEKAPKITWTTPATPSYTLPSSGNLTPAATVTDADNNLIRLTLYSVRLDNGAQTVYFDLPFPQTGSQTLASCFAAAGVATPLNFPARTSDDTYYSLILRAHDASGNIDESTISLVRLASSGGTGGFSPPTMTYPQEFYNSLVVNITATSPATQIQYVQALYGGTLPGTGWTTVVGTAASTTLYGSKRVWARDGDGTNWSAWYFADYQKVYSGGGA